VCGKEGKTGKGEWEREMTRGNGDRQERLGKEGRKKRGEG